MKNIIVNLLILKLSITPRSQIDAKQSNQRFLSLQ